MSKYYNFLKKVINYLYYTEDDAVTDIKQVWF